MARDTAGAEAAPRRVVRLWGALVEGLAALGSFLIVVLMLIICADVVARNVMGGSLPLISEIGALALVMIVFLQLAATVRAGRLARADLFFDGFRNRHPRGGALLAAAFEAVGLLVVGGIAWATLTILGKDFASNEYIGVTGIATLPTWPFRALILIGAVVAALQFLVRMAAALRDATQSSRP